MCVNLSDASFLLPGHWFDMFIAFFSWEERENKKNEQIVPKLVLQFCSTIKKVALLYFDIMPKC